MWLPVLNFCIKPFIIIDFNTSSFINGYSFLIITAAVISSSFDAPPSLTQFIKLIASTISFT